MNLSMHHRLCTSQPATRPALNRSSPLAVGLKLLLLPPYLGSFVSELGGMALAGATGPYKGQPGNCFVHPTAQAANFLQLVTAAQINLLFQNPSEATIFVIRRCIDSTVRSSAVFGFNDGTTSRILAHAPFSDGNLYWDFGNTTTGRLTIAGFVKSTDPESLVFIAGSVAGRKVWRNGVLIGSSGANAAWGGTAAASFRLGAPGGSTTSDLEEVYLFGIANRAWSDAEVREWHRNPWQLFRSPARRVSTYGAPAVPSAGAARRPNVFVAT